MRALIGLAIWWSTILQIISINQVSTNSKPLRQYFLRQPDNQTAIEGQQVTLPCRVENKVGFLQWTRDGFGLGETRDLPAYKRYRLIGSDEEKDWTLEISPVLLEDDALFQCQVGASHGVKPIRSKFAQVTVYVPPGDPIILQGDAINATEGMETKLECVSPGGKPPADILWYNGEGNVVMTGVELRTVRLDDGKRFNTTSILRIRPTQGDHNQTYTCSASNIADRSRRTVSIRLLVKYAPHVELTASAASGEEGEMLSFTCQAHANPPPNQYLWFVNGVEATGFYSNYFYIANISRSYHNSIVKCQVINQIGQSEDSTMITVKYPPRVLMTPHSTAGEMGDTVVLHCFVDSNPPPTYTWTKGVSRQAIGSSQNLTVSVSPRSQGEYFCHAISEGYSLVTTEAASVYMMGPPIIQSPQSQDGRPGANLRVECGGISVPRLETVHWSYMGRVLNGDTNSKYEILTSMESEYTFSSTLLVREAGSDDFGYYGCTADNSKGRSELSILVDKQESVPVLMLVTIVLTSITIVLLIICIAVYYRKDKRSQIEVSEKPFKPNNVNRVSEESDRNGIDGGDSLHSEDQWKEPSPGYDVFGPNTAIPDGGTYPKPDLIAKFPPYGDYLREYPVGSPMDSVSCSSANLNNQPFRHSQLLVSDPRFSATYGNPYLRSPPSGSVYYPGSGGGSPLCYSTFSPPAHSSNTQLLSSLPSADSDRRPPSNGGQQRAMTNGRNGAGGKVMPAWSQQSPSHARSAIDRPVAMGEAGSNNTSPCGGGFSPQQAQQPPSSSIHLYYQTQLNKSKESSLSPPPLPGASSGSSTARCSASAASTASSTASSASLGSSSGGSGGGLPTNGNGAQGGPSSGSSSASSNGTGGALKASTGRYITASGGKDVGTHV